MFRILFVTYQLNEEGVGRDHVDAGKPESNFSHSRISRDLLREQDQCIQEVFSRQHFSRRIYGWCWQHLKKWLPSK
jgi:hypothetical protein